MNENDKELLELAAKAADIKLVWSSVDGIAPRREDTFQAWNPLTDDGDALRLAVKLRMEILVEEIRISVYSELTVEKCEMYPADHLATTRRLIVETAAEIGKAMP